MKDEDEDYAGIVHTETADTVTLINSLGMTNILQKSKIKSRKISQISLMPDGLQTGLSKEEFSDLISYVENPTGRRPVRKPVRTVGGPSESSKPPPLRRKVERQANPLAFLDLPPLPLGPADDAAEVSEPPAPPPTLPPQPHPKNGAAPPPMPPMPAVLRQRGGPPPPP